MILSAFQPPVTATGNKLPYFYGDTASSFFWDLLPEIFSGKKLSAHIEAWVHFLKNNQIGLSDLIQSFPTTANIAPENCLNVNSNNVSELLTSEAAMWNTEPILRTISENKISAVYVIDALLSDKFEIEVNKLKAAAEANEVYFGRLASPSVEAGLLFIEQALQYPNLFGS